MEEKYIISIGRQLGSGGREIAHRLAQRLGIP
ncbi:MAG: cytidylate kinase family protein, partial [Bacteroidaceae bacterium]|nr:cytidylate kinase family protein [Bacteroidaceae bacterium]